jgi:hypothetical protein
VCLAGARALLADVLLAPRLPRLRARAWLDARRTSMRMRARTQA